MNTLASSEIFLSFCLPPIKSSLRENMRKLKDQLKSELESAQNIGSFFVERQQRSPFFAYT